MNAGELLCLLVDEPAGAVTGAEVLVRVPMPDGVVSYAASVKLLDGRELQAHVQDARAQEAGPSASTAAGPIRRVDWWGILGG